MNLFNYVPVACLYLRGALDMVEPKLSAALARDHVKALDQMFRAPLSLTFYTTYARGINPL